METLFSASEWGKGQREGELQGFAGLFCQTEPGWGGTGDGDKGEIRKAFGVLFVILL